MAYPHQPVLVHEAVDCLLHRKTGIYVDGTSGSGGHGSLISKRLSSKGRLICLDRDPEAIRLSRERLASHSKVIAFIEENFAELDTVLERLGIEKVDGVLLDLGMSTYQLEHSGKGFSFKRNEPLDMRMGPDAEQTAADLVNTLSAGALEHILKQYGEERRARSIARAIVRTRADAPFRTSSQLASLIESVSPTSHRKRTIHPATRTFQALRIAVNNELENLDIFLEKIPSLMVRYGRLVILSYHSLEDRRVKQAMVQWESSCTCPPDFPVCVCDKTPQFRRIFKKGIKPPQEEIHMNPSARSAILRAAERM
ncbi:MAG: 16S rRNA (cytosine(1402)-N(4))-methyltransferase RsmH [Deltaproteobacteria bacterium]|nr:16S rRNA (cytosine(1402)-N(4))-methyltransferase RsmH [Deltaproteobacteria bacterium]